jgi:hypothetical protein
LTGYRAAQYAEALSEFGTPLELPHSRSWILERPVPGSPCVDAIGCYPVFACDDWSRLGEDLEALSGRVVSLALVTDAFGNWTEEMLRRCFDRVKPFKEHRVYDLTLPPEQYVARSHRRNARKALRRLRVEVTLDPAEHLEEWTALYGALIQRRHITGIRAFSAFSFAQQLRVPGVTMLRAFHGNRVIAAQLWYVHGEVGYCHLTAGSNLAYTLDAAYALYWSAIQHFRRELHWLDIGASTGLASDGRDGLGAFKSGWSTAIRPVFFCGRILDPVRYDQILCERRSRPTDYFPAYRQGEFV